MADKQQAPSDDLIALYDYWAKQGMGVLVTGNVMVDGRYLGEPGNVVLDSDDHLNQFRKWAAVGQKNGVHYRGLDCDEQEIRRLLQM